MCLRNRDGTFSSLGLVSEIPPRSRREKLHREERWNPPWGLAGEGIGGRMGFMRRMVRLIVISLALGAVCLGEGAEAEGKGSLLEDPKFFPLAVWLQQPRNAERFKAAGINLYVGLWRGPTAEQLEALERSGMPVICAQNRFGLANKENPMILAWMHGDEPDNAQSLGEGKGYGPPIAPEKIQEDYRRMKEADPTRPVFLNLGQGVAWDNYIGRGVRRNHPEDYPEYVKGADIVSFDIYPVVHRNEEIAGKLEMVARGVERLKEWSGGRPVWNCIECTHISNPEAKAGPEEIRAEVWMSIIHGSRGIIYFAHQFEPRFREAALLEDPVNLAAVKRINAQITELAEVLNSPTIEGEVEVKSAKEGVPVASMMKRFGAETYLFTVAMRNEETRASFSGKGIPRTGKVEVLGEDRSIEVKDGRFEDGFEGYGVHLYKINE